MFYQFYVKLRKFPQNVKHKKETYYDYLSLSKNALFLGKMDKYVMCCVLISLIL
jgi:hypothetical protein